MISRLQIQTKHQGLLEISDKIRQVVDQSGFEQGLCTIFIQHTSASLIIQENADPSARRDLENWLNAHVPEENPQFTHTSEGPDDMPSHIKSVLTATSLSIPIDGGKLCLGTWQGIYLWEHRRSAHTRRLTVHIGE